jgi:hypothetical protein
MMFANLLLAEPLDESPAGERVDSAVVYSVGHDKQSNAPQGG